MRIESIALGHRTAKTVNRCNAVFDLSDVPAQHDDGEWNHTSKAPVPEKKAEKYLRWMNTKLMSKNAEGNRRPICAKETKRYRRAEKKQKKKLLMK